MITLTLENLYNHLLNAKFPVKLQPETQQIYLVNVIEKREYPLFISLISDDNVVQLLLFFPINIKPARFSEIARLLHLINKEIDFPGFGMDEETGYVFHRTTLTANDKKIDPALIENCIHAAELLSRTFTPVIENVSTGVLDFASVLKRTIEEKKANSIPS